MLQVTFNEADRILLDMADDAEAADAYDQSTYGYATDCGTPACMMGTYAKKNPESLSARYIRTLGRNWADLSKQLELNTDEFAKIFGFQGCGNAQNDGKKAAAFVREFVRERAFARIEK